MCLKLLSITYQKIYQDALECINETPILAFAREL